MVLADTEDIWTREFNRVGRQYQEPQLVIYRSRYPTACGTGDARMGPFYCPADKKIYIDLGFYDDLARQFDAPGDFAQAYVIAHEVGHHVQTLLGISAKVQKAKRGASEAEANQLSVRQELQADCFAGAWTRRAASSSVSAVWAPMLPLVVKPMWGIRMSAPASASATAIALPMPRLQPVTRAVFPFRSNKLTDTIALLLLFLPAN